MLVHSALIRGDHEAGRGVGTRKKHQHGETDQGDQPQPAAHGRAGVAPARLDGGDDQRQFAI